MNAINTVARGLPIRRRRNTRTWGNASLSVPSESDMVRRIVSWEAFVVDASTHQRIESYPVLTGEDGVKCDAQGDEAFAREQYMLRCQHHDSRPDIQALKDHISIGDWDLTIVIKDAISVS